MAEFLWAVYKISVLFSVCCWAIIFIDCFNRLKKDLKGKIEEYKGVSNKRFPWKSLLLMLPFVVCPVLNVLIAVALIAWHDTFYERVVSKVWEELNEEMAVVKLTQLEEKKEKVEEVNESEIC